MTLATCMILLNVASTWFLVGLIWIIQIVHYPLFKNVGEAQFSKYQKLHELRITFVVGPVMLVEAVSTILLAFYANHVGELKIYLGIGLVLLIWISTAFIQVPCHGKLNHGFDLKAYRTLVQTNWIRTIAWTARGILVCWMLGELLSKI